ncbi:MAG: hypothetical protein RIC55_23355 [Pirellulaceae bacterium]
MPLLGQAAMTSWHDLESGRETDHDHWHSHQHLAERVGIAGFLRGRRYRVVSGEPEYFLMYEVDDLAVLTSEAYQTRLNNPTEWSQRIIPSLRDMNRTLSRVLGSRGQGVSAYALTVRFTAEDQGREALIASLVGNLIPQWCSKPGVTAAHLLEGDAQASGVPTRESRLRGGGDNFADLVLIVEGYDRGVLQSLDTRVAAPADQQLRALYQLSHVVAKADL